MGPYKDWWGAYQLTDLLQKVGVSQNRCDEIGAWLDDSWVSTFCEWIRSKRNRKIKVRIDYFDTWNMDSTLSYIIVPMLKQLKKVKHGAPVVDDNDIPDHLKSTNASPVKEGETDDYYFERWDWVLDEMIWAFEQVNSPPRMDDNRMNRGFILFGKYYSSLWD